MTACFAGTGAVASVLREGDFVVLESVSPPVTTRGLVPILEGGRLRAGDDVIVFNSPGRACPGRASSRSAIGATP